MTAQITLPRSRTIATHPRLGVSAIHAPHVFISSRAVDRSVCCNNLLRCRRGLHFQDRSSSGRSALFQRIAAIAEDRFITFVEVRRAIEPFLPQIRGKSRSEAEFRKNIEQAEDDIIPDLVDPVLLVKDFYSDDKNRIQPEAADRMIEQYVESRLGGDHGRFPAHLRSIGKTPRAYRQMVKEQKIMDRALSQKPR